MASKTHTLTGFGEGPPVGVALTPQAVACARHLEPFRSNWPEGFEEFAISLFDSLINDVRAMSAMEDDEIGVMLDRRPLCERVSMSDLELAYLTSTICSDGTCSLCSTVGPGTTYRSARPGGDILTYEHLCLDCMLTRLRPLS